jgi:hypothetical protein
MVAAQAFPPFPNKTHMHTRQTPNPSPSNHLGECIFLTVIFFEGFMSLFSQAPRFFSSQAKLGYPHAVFQKLSAGQYGP